MDQYQTPIDSQCIHHKQSPCSASNALQQSLSNLITSETQIDWHDKFAILHNACQQIEMRHALGITYKYLSPETILINTRNFKVELQGLNEGHLDKDLVHWTFSSPELMKHMRNPHAHNLTTSTDIWSLGLLVNVIFTMKNLRYVRGCVGFASITPYFFEIIQICMKVQPQERPTSRQLLEFFQDFEENYLQKCSYNMVVAHSLFKQQRSISSTIKLQKLTCESDKDEQQEQEIIVKNGNKDLSDIEILYKNFSFYAIPAKRSEGLIFSELNDRMQSVKVNRLIKIQDQYSIIFESVNEKEGEIEMKITNFSKGTYTQHKLKVEIDEAIKIGNDDSACQVVLSDINMSFNLEIQRKQNGFYVLKKSSTKQEQQLAQSNGQQMSKESREGSSEVQIRLDSDMAIQPQTILWVHQQRYFVKSIN